MAPMRSRRRARGFTLVELMIALVVGGIAIGAMYSIGSASTRQFREQYQLGTTQGALRTAMMQVKRDIARAGYLGTPRADLPGQSCSPVSAGLSGSIVGGGVGWIAGISSFRDNVVDAGGANAAVDPSGLNAINGFTADQLTLVGNYETANQYPGVQVVSPTIITIDVGLVNSWHSVFQDFAWTPAGVPATTVQLAAVQQAFSPRRLIRIQGPNRRKHFATVVGVTTINADAIAIEFTPALPSDCSEEMRGGWVAPLSVIQYSAQPGAGFDAERFGTTTNETVGYLMRTELEGATRTARQVVGTSGGVDVFNVRSVLGYLAAFNVTFTMSAANLDSGQADNYQVGVRTATAANVNTFPERVRAVQVTLAARLPTEDPTFPSGPAPFTVNCGGLRCFKIWPASQTLHAARVRVLRAEIFVPNIASEGY